MTLLKKTFVLLSIFAAVFVVGIGIIFSPSIKYNGGSLILCAIRQASPLAGFSIGRCPVEVGKKTLFIQVCNLLLNEQARGMCRGAYAVQNNKLEICLALNAQDMSQQPFCLTNFAIKNKDISLCDKTESLPRDYVREHCRSEVLRNFQLEGLDGLIKVLTNNANPDNSINLDVGATAPTYEGTINSTNIKDNFITLKMDNVTYGVNVAITTKIVDKNSVPMYFSNIKSGHLVRAQGLLSGTTINAYTITDLSL